MLSNYTIDDLLKDADQEIIEKRASKNSIDISGSEAIKLAEKLMDAAEEIDSNKFKTASSIVNNDISFNEKVAQAINLVNVIQEIGNLNPLINFVKEAEHCGYSQEEAIEFYKENNK